MCCQAVCFVTLRNVNVVDHARVPKDIRKEMNHKNKTLTLVLVRWFAPHPHATERNSKNLPMCPAPFNINHALWRLAVTPNSRSILVDRNGRPTKQFRQQSRMFGITNSQQMDSLRREAHAYYGLIRPSSIRSIAFMSPEFELNTTKSSSTWIQTITSL